MQFKLKATLPILIFAALSVSTVQSSSPDRLGVYDFSYHSSGDQRVRPAQVFDDGRSTYFQFRAGEPIPAIFAVTSSGPSLLVPEPEGPYIRVPSVAAGYVLRLGYGLGKVAYTGQARSASAADALMAIPATHSHSSAAVDRLMVASAAMNSLPQAMVQPAQRVALEENSYATPIKGDRTVWTGPEEVSQDFTVPFAVGKSRVGPLAMKTLRALAGSLQSATKVEVTGRDDHTYKEGLAEARAAAIADVLASAGVPRSRIVMKTNSQVVTGSGKGVVVGGSITARTIKQPQHHVADARVPRASRIGATGQVDSIVSQLRAGQISPAQAANALETARNAPQRGAGPWSVRKADGTVESMLIRWGQDAGWRVISKGAPVIEIHGDAEVDRREFLHAADYAITQAKNAGYRIKATAYSNNVLVLSGE